VKSEATAQPVNLGTGNNSASTATSQSAFQPIITDIASDLSVKGAEEYRKFIYYAPTAEYRFNVLSSSKQEIRNIDIQVYWKNRLNSQLYPVEMPPLSTVSIKMMFMRKELKTKT
jgi:hypothetical protein